VPFAPEFMVGRAMDASPIFIFIFISSSWPCATAADANPSSTTLVNVTKLGDGGCIGEKVAGRQKRVPRVVKAAEK
jgi:hypothetical protein